MAALTDVDEVIRAHQFLVGPGPGAPPIANGARVGASLLHAATTLISAVLQSEVEETFRAALPRSFDYFNQDALDRYWSDCRQWGDPNPENVRRLFFRIGFPDVLAGLSWQKCPNATVISVLDEINQVRNRIAHGQPLTVKGRRFRLTKPKVVRWRNYAAAFLARFQPFVLAQYP